MYQSNVYKKAKKIAMCNKMRYHVAAIVWRKKKPIFIRSNSHKGHPSCLRTLDGGSMTSSMHAEMNVLRFAKKGDKIEVIRWGKSGEKLCSKPCDMCENAMRSAGIAAVSFVDSNGKRATIDFR